MPLYKTESPLSLAIGLLGFTCANRKREWPSNEQLLCSNLLPILKILVNLLSCFNEDITSTEGGIRYKRWDGLPLVSPFYQVYVTIKGVFLAWPSSMPSRGQGCTCRSCLEIA